MFKYLAKQFNRSLINLRKNIFLVFFSLFLVCGCLEFFCRFTMLDAKNLWDSLYFVEGTSPYAKEEIYIPADAKRLYKLKPNSFVALKKRVNALETKYVVFKSLIGVSAFKNIYQPLVDASRLYMDKIEISINNAGFRSKKNIALKKDKYRILLLGGSHTFGFSLSDNQCYDVLLENIFKEKYGKEVEVINAGVTAYVMTQKVAYGEQIIKKYNPDMIIMQDSNKGRRAFFYRDENYYKYFYENKELFSENIPLLFSENKILKDIHFSLVDTSALYRFFLGSFNNLLIKQHFRDFKRDVTLSPYTIIDEYNSQKTILRNQKVFSDFVKTYGAKIPIFTFDPTKKLEAEKSHILPKNNYGQLIFASASKTDEYFQIHPPSYVYKWYAQQIANILSGYILK